MNNFRRDLLLLVSAVALCLLIWIAAFISGYAVIPLPAELHSKVPGGRVEKTIQPFLQTPFVVDAILNERIDSVFYKHPTGNLKGAAEQTWRIYAPGASEVTVTFHYIGSKSSTPRVWLYDAHGRLLQAGIPSTIKADHHERFVLNPPQPGMYKVKMCFQFEQVAEISVAGGSNSNDLSYKDYVRKNTKTIELIVAGGELEKLNELVGKAKKIWNSPPPVNGLWPQYSGIEGRIFGSLRTDGGRESTVAIGLSGRSSVHLPTDDSPLPSLDIKVLSGPLPFGLRRFKLYTASAKSSNEIVHESMLEDCGILVPRQDRVEVVVNGNSVGHMFLLEGLDAGFFEAAQRIEGPVFGYDPDDAVANASRSRFTVKEFVGAKSAHKQSHPDLAGPQFESQLNTLQMLLAQSYGLTYASYHGLGQADLRFHWNFRSETFDPIVKDLDPGILAPEQGALQTSWAYLNPLAPLWRPNAVSGASYFVLFSASGRTLYEARHGGFYLWQTPPSTLRVFEKQKNLSTFQQLTNMWASGWSRSKVGTRLGNLHFALGDNPASYQLPKQITQDLLGQARWDSAVHQPTAVAKRIGVQIENLTSGRLSPDRSTLASLDWRNAAIREIYGMPNKLDTEKAQRQLLAFLYRTEEPGVSHIILAERGPMGYPLEVRLTNSEGVVYAPKVARFYDGVKKQASKQEVELSDIKVNEAVRLYWFEIKRTNDYQYLHPDLKGPGVALFPYEIAIAPVYGEPSQSKEGNLATYFDSVGALLRIKESSPPIVGEVVIPRGTTLVVATDATVKFAKSGCLKVLGDIDIAANANLTLTAESGPDGWSGIHFLSGNDRKIRNLNVDGVGYGESFVTCGKSKYSGGVSFYNTRVSLSNSRITNSRIEDTLHVLYSEVDIDNLRIENTNSDCLDSDFSVLRISKSSFKYCGVTGLGGGDGIDISGSLLHLDRSSMINVTDKGISVGENSRAYITNSTTLNSDIGVASKDGSFLKVEDSLIDGCRVGITSYSKKPYFPASTIEFDDSVSFINNQEKANFGMNQTSESNRVRK